MSASMNICKSFKYRWRREYAYESDVACTQKTLDTLKTVLIHERITPAVFLLQRLLSLLWAIQKQTSRLKVDCLLQNGFRYVIVLEAARVATNRVLMDKLVNDYLMVVHPYPHIILRENKMIFGAHADRLQQGMRRSFGTAVGTAAKVEVGQTIITVKVKASAIETAKESLKRGSAKLPIACKIVISKIQASPAQVEEAQPETETT